MIGKLSKTSITLAVLVCFFLLTNFSIISLLLVIFWLALYLPLKKPFGIISKLVLSFLIISGLQQVLALFFWFSNNRFTYDWDILIIAVIVFILTMKRPIYPVKTSRNEIFAMLTSFFSVGLILLSTYQSHSINQENIRFITRGFDNATHMSLIYSNYENQGYLYDNFDNISSSIVYKSLSGYPQGWHLSSAQILAGIDDNLGIFSTKGFMLFYVILVMFWYGILLFVLSMLIVIVSQELLRGGRDLGIIDYAVGFVALLIIQAGFLLSILSHGFANYIAVLSSVVGMVLLLYANFKKMLSLRLTLFLLALFASSIAFTWLLAAPVGYTIYCSVLITSYIGRRGSLRKYFLLITPSLLIALIGIAQLAIQVKFSEIPNNINAEGGVWATNRNAASLLCVVCIYFYIFTNLSLRLKRLFVETFIAAAPIVGAIYLYQYATAAKFSYYSEKLGLILIVLLIAFSVALLIPFAHYLTPSLGKIKSGVFVISVILVLPFILGLDMKEIRFAFNSDRKLSMTSASQINELIAKKQAYRNNVVVSKELDYEEDVITTHFANSLSRQQTECSSNITWDQITNNKPSLFEHINRCSTNENNTYYLLVSSKNFSSYKQRFQSNPNVHVVLSN